MAQGEGAKGIRSLEEGLRLAAAKGGVEHADQVALMLDLGRAQAERALWQGALETLSSAKRLLEHTGDRRRLVQVLGHLATAYQGMGQMVPAGECLKEAFALAVLLDDLELLAGCQLQMGIFRSCQQHAGAALDHLDRALQGFAKLGDRAMTSQAQAWKARTVATLGDAVLAELLFLQASAVSMETLTPMEKGDRVLLEGELALFKGAWAEARKHFQAAANRFNQAGLVWRERMARIRGLQAEARGPCAPEALTSAWIRLEALKGPVEASDSRWLELEWHRAHALVLSRSGGAEAVIADTLVAWGEVLAGARELGMPALLLEASACCAQLLLDRGERLGARSRAQDAAAAFQELWARVPAAYGPAFLARQELQAYRATAERAGMPIPLPERADPLADWSPTQVNLPSAPSS
jgi:tetratricopeptide (TPR) repeat protein